MAILINGETALSAWQKGIRLISINNKEVFNLVTTIDDPIYFEADWIKEHDPRSFDNKIPSLSDVITTIFPYKLLNRGYSRDDLYRRYLVIHDRARRRKRRWGTYFERMIRFGDGNKNQLEEIIQGVNSWSNNYKAALVMHTSSADTDSLRKTIGNPCLQFIEILCPDSDTISLLAVYRNHDFNRKALGNFIALGQLLKFICDETGRNAGTLTCHSAHAYYDISKANIFELAKL